MNKMRVILLAVLVSFVILTTWWRQQVEPVATKTKSQTVQQQPDFFLEEFATSQYSVTGELIYRFSGEQLEHFAAGDYSEVKQPNLQWYPKDKPVWTLNADQAKALSVDLDQIEFSGNVLIQQLSTANEPAIELVTNTLLVKPNSHYAETKDLVTITRIDGQLIAAAGLTANFQEGKFTFFQVKGVYQPQ